MFIKSLYECMKGIRHTIRLGRVHVRMANLWSGWRGLASLPFRQSSHLKKAEVAPLRLVSECLLLWTWEEGTYLMSESSIALTEILRGCDPQYSDSATARISPFPFRNYTTSTSKQNVYIVDYLNPEGFQEICRRELCHFYSPFSFIFSPLPSHRFLSHSCGSLPGYIFTQLILDASV
jgi:hypothetical protein